MMVGMADPTELRGRVELETADPHDGAVPWRLGHRPALDGLRAIALLAVLAGHAGTPGLPNIHNLGVEVFFVLSGFLITSLLVEEYLEHGRIALGSFYLRRVRRLAPALFAFIAIVVAASLVFDLFERREVMAGAESSLLYVTNFVRARGTWLGPFEHLWSLAVEEHFYLLWPMMLVAILGTGGRRRLRVALAIVIVGAVASALLRFALADNILHTVNWTPCRASGLFVGCALAIVVHGDQSGLLAVRQRVWTVAGAASLAVIAVLGSTIFESVRGDLYALPLVDLATAILIVGLILAPGPLTAALSWRPLQRTGRLSYAAYLWHYPVFLLLGTMAALTLPQALVGLLITAGLAELSMRFVESPFRVRRTAA